MLPADFDASHAVKDSQLLESCSHMADFGHHIQDPSSLSRNSLESREDCLDSEGQRFLSDRPLGQTMVYGFSESQISFQSQH